MSTGTATNTRGPSHHLRGRAPAEVQRLMEEAVRGTGGAGSQVRWADLRDWFEAQGMEREHAEAFAGELLYRGPYAVRGPQRGTYVWRPDAMRLLRHRSWRWPRGQLDLASALAFMRMVETTGGPDAMPPALASLYDRLRKVVPKLR